MHVLMILGTNQYGSSINTSLYSVTKRKIILELSFPNDDERCCGSSHGWLVFQRSDDIIYLFNPFSGETIHLPSLSYHVDKVVLSKNPSTNPYDVEVVAIVQCGFVPLGLAILRPGSNEWIVMTHGMSRHVVCDVIYYDDRYYVVTSHGRVLSIDKMTLDLNEISGPAPVSVKIYKLVVNPMTQESMFVELDDLGNEALFLSEHSSMSVTASKFSGCIANSVYYTGGPLEMFVLSRRFFRNSLFTSPLRIPQPICMMLRSSLLVWLSYDPGSNEWIVMTHHPGGLSRHHVRDVIYYDDRYYVVASDGSVLSIDKMSLDSTTKFFHLIKSTANELLMVRLSRPNYFLSSRDERPSVEIFKLIVNPMNQESMFAELDDLVDEALFLSEQGSMSVSASKFSGCIANSVYYTSSRLGSNTSGPMLDLVHYQDGTHFSFEGRSSSDIRINMKSVLWIIPTPKFTTNS
ncbi:hypothetical protein T459_28699 [Capsicum annuum]|uniref:KIB1-4 beta-propeller domain-containing protein n=1 Tax=Capsicum annuum TaxID=4072 RepID=A0A2G2YHH9_CAPAN|nr:hypothetical protein T459_28699 [Capsicum annuum]